MKFQDFKESSLEVTGFRGFEVSRIQGFEVSMNQGFRFKDI
jgi:hypothetical protein